MRFLAQNWFYIVVLILFVAMHLIGPGCGHAHRRHKHSNLKESDDRSPAADKVRYQQ